MAVATSSVIRCKRCATILRNRTVCPSCGLEVSAAPAGGSGAAKAVGAASASGAAKGVGAASASGSAKSVSSSVSKRNPGKVGMKMCPVCFSSVSEETLVEHNGQKICPECQMNLAKPDKPE